MEVTNRTLTTLLGSLASKSLKDWDVKLRHAEFAYNKASYDVAKHSPFKSAHGVNPLTPIDLLPIPTELRASYKAKLRAKEMKKLHA